MANITRSQIVEYVETYIDAVEARATTGDLVVYGRIDGTFDSQPQQYELADDEIELALISDPSELSDCTGMTHDELIEHLIGNNDLSFYLTEKLGELQLRLEEASNG